MDTHPIFKTRLESYKQATSPKFTAKSNGWTVFLETPSDSETQGLNVEKHIKKK